MATGKYRVTHPAVTDAVGGDATNATIWNDSWEDDHDVELNAAYDAIEDDITALQEAAILRGYDSSLYEWKNSAAVTMKAGSQFAASDGTRLFTVSADTDITLPGMLSGDATGAPSVQNSTFYYIWGGEDANGDLKFYISDLADTMPTELVKGARIRKGLYIDSSGDITLFSMDSATGFYQYEVQALCNGSDQFEVLDAGISTSAWTDVDCSSFVPAGCTRARIAILCSYELWARRNGDTHGGYALRERTGSTGARQTTISLDSSGVFEAKQGGSTTTVRISVIGF